MRKNSIISIIIIIIATTIFLISKNNKQDINTKSINVEKYLQPISKEIVVKILKLEYGDMIDINEKDIKQIGDEYQVEVLISIEDTDEDYEHSHNELESHSDLSLGVHKINIYTGEVEFPE